MQARGQAVCSGGEALQAPAVLVSWTPGRTCLSLLEETQILVQKGGEELLPDPQVDPGFSELEAASSAACGQRAVGSGGMERGKGQRRREGMSEENTGESTE